jgi:hypothetical protein
MALGSDKVWQTTGLGKAEQLQKGRATFRLSKQSHLGGWGEPSTTGGCISFERHTRPDAPKGGERLFGKAAGST